jgi:hypothetical protein
MISLIGTSDQASADMHSSDVRGTGLHLVRALERGRGRRVPDHARRAACAAGRLQLRDPLPDNISLMSRPRYTPTFVVVQDGTEVGRIEGYPGEDFFWGLLGRILEQEAPNG